MVSVYVVVVDAIGAISVAADGVNACCVERCSWYSTMSRPLSPLPLAYAGQESTGPVEWTTVGEFSDVPTAP